VLSLSTLSDLADAFRSELDLPVAPLVVGDRTFDLDARPAVMGCINLSRDSTYRESVAVSTEAAVRRGRVLAAQGADFVDVGAESSTARATRVGVQAQLRALVPVVERLTADGILVSAETYHPQVVAACLRAGAKILNFTGLAHEEEVFDLAAEYDATVLLCHVRGTDVREVTDVDEAGDPLPGLVDYFAARVDLARSRGVRGIVLDPGMGFFYGNLTDPRVRVRHQARVILNTFRLRRLGLPVCHALPHAFDLFEDQFRTAEGLFAVLAYLGGTGVFRTHEVPQVRAVLATLRTLDAR
jgi:dihydropteroate synthase